MVLHYNGTKLPFCVKFAYSLADNVEITQVWKYEQIPNNSEFITIKENWKIGLQFYVVDEESWDSESYIEIQTSLFDEADNQTTLSYKLTTDDNEIQWIYSDINEGVYPWRMGSYLIDIYYKGEKYTTAIKVAPTHLNSKQIEQIHSYLQGVAEGIIYDYVLSNQSYSQITSEELKTKWFYEYARFITDTQNLIVYALSKIEKNPYTQITNEYKQSKQIGKIGIKSVKWELMNGYSDSGKYFNKVKSNVYNTLENKWIKYVVYNWKSEISKALTLIRRNHQILQEETLTLEQKRRELESEKNRLNKKWNIAKTVILNLNSQILIKEKEIKEKMGILNQHERWINSLDSIKNRMVHLLANSFLSDIQIGQKKPLLKQNVYFLLDELYQESKKIKENEGNKKRLIKIYKPTWLIFEYYCLFTTLNILKELGFDSTEGFHPQMLDQFYENKIPSGHKFTLENSNSIIHVWYDKYHAHSNNEASEKGELFFTNLLKKRPDIKMDVYKKVDNGDLLFKDSIVIDAKFRKLQSIYSKDYVKDTFDQLISYNQFFYSGENRMYNSRGSIVNRVICLYASEDGTAVKQVEQPITFIKLFPEIKDESVIEVGKKELKEEFIEWLDGVI